MKQLIVVSLGLIWLLQAVPTRLFAKTPFDQSSVRSVFDEDEPFVDSRYLSLEEDLSSKKQ